MEVIDKINKTTDEDVNDKSKSNNGKMIQNDAFVALQKRVDRMESSIDRIISKVDAVLVKLEAIERAKSKRRENIGKLMTSISEMWKLFHKRNGTSSLKKISISYMEQMKTSLFGGLQVDSELPLNYHGLFYRLGPAKRYINYRANEAGTADLKAAEFKNSKYNELKNNTKSSLLATFLKHSDEPSEERKRQQMEKVVKEELDKWDN
ncbi:hypothetical protein HELRODRAFT_171409 [Helobdella robusta]|uniref:Uncharacterized protein n=1 Tax=Helobdella robusta TaxID=6412 RepID=T1F488_HELRO|nr:hypothetical protein HELRODRAFT_171409 [Helobdella robusta]ESO05741.1 hypothetical protein HELRODRAFT_171409 [Helobdella robusta]